MDIKGFEPLTFSMQSRRSTTDLNALFDDIDQIFGARSALQHRTSASQIIKKDHMGGISSGMKLKKVQCMKYMKQNAVRFRISYPNGSSNTLARSLNPAMYKQAAMASAVFILKGLKKK